VSAEYLEDAVATLRARAEADLAPVIAHVARRAARLARREESLARGRAGRAAPQVATPDRPIEMDPTTARSTPADTEDTSIRGALLELDAAPQQPARTRRTIKRAA
jgi:hypothetical protein